MVKRIQYEIDFKNNVSSVIKLLKEAQTAAQSIEDKEHSIKIGVDDKKLNNVLSKLEKTLTDFDKGTIDLKGLESLSKQLNDINVIAQKLSGIFDGIDTSSFSGLETSIGNIGKMIATLKDDIANVISEANKGNKTADIGGATKRINEEIKLTERLINARNKLKEVTVDKVKSLFTSKTSDTDEEIKLTERLINARNKLRIFRNKETNSEMGDVSGSSKNAAKAKREFVDANEKVQSSVDGSKTKLELEAELMESIAKNAREAAKAKREFVEANKRVRESADKSVRNGTSMPETPGKKTISSEKVADSLDGFIPNGKVLRQTGYIGDEKFSAVFRKNDGQTETITWKALTDNNKVPLLDNDGNYIYDMVATTISKYSEFEKILIREDNKLRQLEDKRQELSNMGIVTDGLNEEIEYRKKYISMIEETVSAISKEKEYFLEEQQIMDARKKAETEYYLAKGSKQDETAAKKQNNDIKNSSKLLDSMLLKINKIERSYNKGVNGVLDKYVSNQDDIQILSDEKRKIEDMITSLRSSSNGAFGDDERIALLDAVSMYEENAKRILQRNNPSVKGKDKPLSTQISEAIAEYVKLISKAEKYDSITEETLNALKEQKDILSRKDNNNNYLTSENELLSIKDNLLIYKAMVSSIDEKKKEATSVNSGLSEDDKKTLKEYQKKLAGFKNKSEKLGIIPYGFAQSDWYASEIKRYQSIVQEMETLDSKAKNGSITNDDISRWGTLTEQIKKTDTELKKFTSSQKGSRAEARWKEIDKITKYLKDNTRISASARHQLEMLLETLKKGENVDLGQIHKQVNRITTGERLAGREGQRFLDVLKDKVWYRWAAQIGAMFGISDIIGYFRQGIEAVEAYDEGLTKMSYTMDLSKTQLDNLGDSVLETSRKLKSSVDNAMQVAQIYANMNTTAQEIDKLSQPTLIMSNLTGFDASTVADQIQAVTQQFDITAESSMHIADVYDQISRNISVDYSKIFGAYIGNNIMKTNQNR